MNNLLDIGQAISNLHAKLATEPRWAGDILIDYAEDVNEDLFFVMEVNDDSRRYSNSIAETSDPDYPVRNETQRVLDLGVCHPKLEEQNPYGNMMGSLILQLCADEVLIYPCNNGALPENRIDVRLDYAHAVIVVVTHLATQIAKVMSANPTKSDELARIIEQPFSS